MIEEIIRNTALEIMKERNMRLDMIEEVVDSAMASYERYQNKSLIHSYIWDAIEDWDLL